ncbi:hypothetical protein R3P38DRAFT_3256128 [Favolaschia claudopus]|uniref:Uncharacterized protein n=1 Tax=Favolaschia claudopus TaxID=2862362 RepID=A0AAW0DGA7_9AGAR
MVREIAIARFLWEVVETEREGVRAANLAKKAGQFQYAQPRVCKSEWLSAEQSRRRVEDDDCRTTGCSSWEGGYATRFHNVASTVILAALPDVRTPFLVLEESVVQLFRCLHPVSRIHLSSLRCAIFSLARLGFAYDFCPPPPATSPPSPVPIHTLASLGNTCASSTPTTCARLASVLPLTVSDSSSRNQPLPRGPLVSPIEAPLATAYALNSSHLGSALASSTAVF